MFSFILGLIVGLVVGWNLFPQPEFVKNAFVKFRTWLGF